MFLKNKALRYLILSLALLGAALLLSWYEFTPLPPKKVAHQLEKTLQEKEKELSSQLNTFPFSKDSCNNAINLIKKTKDLFEKKACIFLLYQKDSLIFWSENAAPFPLQHDSTELCSPLLELANGWYLIKTRSRGDFSWTVLYLVHSKYPYENDYLVNGFNKDLGVKGNFEISKQANGVPVNNASGETLFYIHPSKTQVHSEGAGILLLILYLASFLFLSLALYVYLGKLAVFRNRKTFFLLLFSFGFILARILLFYFRIPYDLYDTPLFGPIFYASSAALPSLGDLLINSFCFLFLSFLVFRAKSHLNKARNANTAFLLSACFHAIVLFLLYLYIHLYAGLILNSNIPLDLSNPVSFNLNTLYAICITAAVFLGIFLLSLALLFVVVNRSLPIIASILPAAISWIVFVLILFFTEANVLLLTLFSIFFLVTLHLILRRDKSYFTLPALFSYLLLFTIFSSAILISSLNTRERSQRRLMAQNLSVERDPIAEYLIQEQYKLMLKDEVLKKDFLSAIFSDFREMKAIEFFRTKYFQDYWSKYNLTFTLCHPGRMLNVVVPNNAVVDCGNFFQETIRTFGKPSSTQLLSYLDYGNESINYLAALPFTLSTGDYTVNIIVYIDIVSKTIPKGLGYPELLMSKNTGFGPDLNQYSYAIYDKQSLLRSNGKFAYSLKSYLPSPTIDHFLYYHNAGFNHLAYQTDKDKTIIISQQDKSWRDLLTPFSYLLLFYAVFLLIVLALTGYVSLPRFSQMNFSSRLQVYMISLILSAFIITGFVTFRYINSLYSTKNVQNLREKTHSVLSELQQKLVLNGPLSTAIGNDLYFLLNKFSLIFFTDINLYDLHGNLMASSRPQIFEEGLLSTKMDNLAFYELNTNKKSMFVQEEKIGNYQFLSAYMPLRNGQDELIGYLDLPYFAKQGEIRNELSTFFVAFLNIYVILIVLAVVIALFIATYITRPLRVIREKMSMVKLGKSNEKLGWIRKDEIGLLVEEYNNMIDKLAQSAAQLAQSERESAWREMARQVAHEIKNPLTPMKLSVQLLQRAWDEKETDWDQRLKRFSNSLIEQIDTLSAIASEFSDFAQMPQSRLEVLKLEEIVQNAFDLFHNQEIFEARFVMAQHAPYMIRADKKQLHRVFSNLFRNSIQAFPLGHKGIITIALHKDHHQIRLDFTDNGSGIPADQQKRIFSPNFTTKSGGMGLGLPMVKNIIQECGGEISFRSEENFGTTFTLVFPIAD